MYWLVVVAIGLLAGKLLEKKPEEPIKEITDKDVVAPSSNEDPIEESEEPTEEEQIDEIIAEVPAVTKKSKKQKELEEQYIFEEEQRAPVAPVEIDEPPEDPIDEPPEEPEEEEHEP